MKELSVIILSYNTKELLRQCLRSLSPNWEVIVVDNGSTDGSAEAITKEFPWIKLVRNRENLGFARGVNQGIKIAQGDFIFLLNSDTKVRAGSLEKLVKFAKSKTQVGIIGARLLDPDGKIQSSCYHLPSILGAITEYWFGRKGTYEKYTETGNLPAIVDAVVGATMLIPRATLNRVGFFDERYFMYFEDFDYCRRVKRAGLEVFYFPGAEVIHYHGKSAALVGDKAYTWLIQSSKIFNGKLKHLILTLIIFLGQKWQKLIGKKKRK